MTDREYRRLRKWELRTQKAYSAGVIEGMDCFHTGYPRPEDPDEGYDAPFDINVYFFLAQRLEQYYRNNELARMRGAVDGYDQAQEMVEQAETEDWIETQVVIGMKQLVDYLRIGDRSGDDWGLAA